MDREGLAEFLRTRRERLRPEDIGLPPGRRRRAKGLRRDEVAALATISVDYYARLEQRRGPHPSVSVLTSLARALRLSTDERDHLFHLAGQPAPTRPSGAEPQVGPGLLHLLDRLTDVPALIVDDLGTVLTQNRMSVLVSGDHTEGDRRRCNFPLAWFTRSGSRDRFPTEDHAKHSRLHVADLRATHSRRGGDPEVSGLVAELRAASAEFAELWDRHEVAVHRSDEKRIIHPEVGLLDLLCERLVSELDGVILIVLRPRPGTDCRDRLELLSAIGHQRFAAVSESAPQRTNQS